MPLDQWGRTSVKKNVGKGYTKLGDGIGPGVEIEVYQMAITASEDCQVTFGGPGSAATPTWSLLKGIPLVLPYVREGWFDIDASGEFGVLVQTAAGTIDVGILATIRKV
jgi:hypothetical protein